MHFTRLTRYAAAFAAPLCLGWTGMAQADAYRVSGPVVHANLAIYFIHGASAPGKVPLTLDEALAKGMVKVYETSNVNSLAIENLGSEDIFVQSGDIVKGGQQDRTLTISMILPAKSGRVPIAAFCVEQGRWSARGGEDVSTFASSKASLFSREAKIAMKAPTAQATASSPARPVEADTGARQQEIWRAAKAAQDKLSGSVGGSVAAPQSASSLQLAYENEKLEGARAGYLKSLLAAGQKDDDIVGYVFAVNGKINSGDVYASNGLFRKMWSKQLAATATEAIGEKTAGTSTPPTVAAVQAFLESAERGKASDKALPVSNKLETRVGDAALYFETKRAGGSFVHKNYLMK